MRTTPTLPWRTVGALLVFLAIALAGCADDQTMAPSAVPGVAIRATAGSLFAAERDRVSTEVKIDRVGGFADPITLSVSGLPEHVTADIAPNPVREADIASVVIAVGDDVGPGVYPLTVHATGAGIETRTVPLDLHVILRSPMSVVVAFCSDAAPAWVAFQDGDGTWTRAPAIVNGSTTTFRRLFVTNRGAIATLTPMLDGALTLLTVLYGTPAELASAGDSNPRDCGNGKAKTLLGKVAGLDAGESVLISSGAFLRAQVPAGRASFTLTGLPSGPQDLLATASRLANGNPTVSRLLLRRSIDLPDSAQIATLDFASQDAIAPVTQTVSILGLGADGAISTTRLRTSHSEMVLSSLTTQSTLQSRPYYALPASQLLSTDLQVLHVSTVGNAVGRDAEVYFRSPSDRTVSLGAPITPPMFTTLENDGLLRVRAQFATQSDYDRLTSISYQQDPTSALVTVSMTAAYAAINGTGFGLDVPDLSAAAGFDPAWGLRPGLALQWTATRMGGTLGLGRDAEPSEGTIVRRASRKDIITLR